MKVDMGINICLKGETPLDDKLKDIYKNLHGLALNPSKQLYIRDLTTRNNIDSIEFDINVILWGPFGNEFAAAFWQSIDILMSFESVRLEVKSIIGYKNAC